MLMNSITNIEFFTYTFLIRYIKTLHGIGNNGKDNGADIQLFNCNCAF